MLTSPPPRTTSEAKTNSVIATISVLFFLSGFTALLYQVAWQRMLGLFSGSDVRSVTIIIASYLAGLGLGNLIGGWYSDRATNRQCVRIYGGCNLGIAAFAVLSRFLFYDWLFLRWRYLADSSILMLIIVFFSLLIPTSLMGLSLPLLSKAVSRHAKDSASRIGLLYGVNTLGSGIGTFLSGWYIIGTIGYEKTVYFGAVISALVGAIALICAERFTNQNKQSNNTSTLVNPSEKIQSLKIIDEDSDESEKVIDIEEDSKSEHKPSAPKEIPREVVKVKPAVLLKELPKEKIDNNKPKYGATADFSWIDKPIEYVRHCPKCNKFVKTDNSGDFNCPVCNTPMRFSIHCKTCNLWFDVKGPKKYPCPRCNQIISHGNS
jgi:hypothetical protein